MRTYCICTISAAQQPCGSCQDSDALQTETHVACWPSEGFVIVIFMILALGGNWGHQDSWQLPPAAVREV